MWLISTIFHHNNLFVGFPVYCLFYLYTLWLFLFSVLFIIKINQYIWNYIYFWCYCCEILFFIFLVVVRWFFTLGFSWELVILVPGKYSPVQFIIKDISNYCCRIWLCLYPENNWLFSHNQGIFGNTKTHTTANSSYLMLVETD